MPTDTREKRKRLTREESRALTRSRLIAAGRVHFLRYGLGGAVAETIEDFTIALSGDSAITGTATVSLGGVASYPLVITPVGGATLPGTVSLNVAGLPAGLAGVFTPATVAANSGTTNVTLKVGPPGKAAIQPDRNRRGLILDRQEADAEGAIVEGDHTADADNAGAIPEASVLFGNTREIGTNGGSSETFIEPATDREDAREFLSVFSFRS